jgi:hypothetical protein
VTVSLDRDSAIWPRTFERRDLEIGPPASITVLYHRGPP